MTRKNRIYSILVCVIILGFSFIVLDSCGGGYSCDGKNCKSELGFTDNKKPSERNAEFIQNNPIEAKQFNVYIECSASMDGYVTGNTQFKTDIHRIIGQITADVLSNDTCLSLNLINSVIINSKKNPKQFSQSLSPAFFKSENELAHGDRANSDIIEIIENVIKQTPSKGLSMFVSDCVYSPEGADDIDKALKKQETDLLNALKRRTKNEGYENFGVLLYRFESDFNGIYYTKTNSQININNGKRPYFVWFFGDESILASVYRSINSIREDRNADFIATIKGYKYLPYKTLGSDHFCHFLNAKANTDGLYNFSFIADLSYLPLSKDYICNVDNYICAKDKYYIKSIEPYDETSKDSINYNYRFRVAIKGGKNNFITPTVVEISMRSMSSSIPKWVKNNDDPKGNDYDNGYKATLQRTFGLESLVEGLNDFYNNKEYITFKIKIN